jgi:hypothetical protein
MVSLMTEGGAERSPRLALASFGRNAARKLGRGGDPEDQLRGPLEILLQDVATCLGTGAIPYGEVQLRAIRARPDYAVDVGRIDAGSARVGYRGRGIRDYSIGFP